MSHGPQEVVDNAYELVIKMCIRDRRYFAKGFLIGTLCICLLGLVWLFAFQPRLTAQEAQDLKAQFTTIPCLLYTSRCV